MGISIHMSISQAVTKNEWAMVYEETLQLVDAFPLAERREVNCSGVETVCLVRTKETEETYEWNDEKIRIGWLADGDYETMHTAEEYALYRNMLSEGTVYICICTK